MLVGFFLAIILNRLLGPEGKGMFVVFDSNARFLVSIFGFNLGAAIIFFQSSGGFSAADLWHGIWRYLIPVAALAALAAGVLFVANPRYIFYPSTLHHPQYLLYYSIWVPLAVGNYLFRCVLHSRKHIDRANIILLVVKVLRLIALGSALMVLTYWRNPELVTVVLLLNGLFMLISMTLMAYYSGKGLIRPKGHHRKAITDFKPLFRYAGFLQLEAILYYLNYKIDHWVILYFWDTQYLGWYSAATDIAQTIWLASTVAVMLLFPYLSDISIDHNTKFKLFGVFLRAIFSITLIGLVFVLVFGDWLIIFLFGPLFYPSGECLRILIVGMGALNLAHTHAVWLTSGNKTKYMFYAAAIGFALTLPLDLLLIPPFGIEGAAWSTTLAFLAMTAYHLWISRVKFGVPLRATWIFTYRDWQELRRLLDTVR